MALKSDLICQGSNFTDNRAFITAGAVMVSSEYSGGVSGSYALALFENSRFVGSLARDFAGAIELSWVSDGAIIGCVFRGSHAGFQGGAVYVAHTYLLVASSCFVGNSCGGRGTAQFAGLDPYGGRDGGRHHEGGGPAISGSYDNIPRPMGGAIMLGTRIQGYANESPQHFNYTTHGHIFEISTEDCFFIGNKVVPNAEPGAFVDSSQLGWDIGWGGRGSAPRYMSNSDHFLNTRERAIAMNNYTTYEPVILRSRFYPDAAFVPAGDVCLPRAEIASAYAAFSVAPLPTRRSLSHELSSHIPLETPFQSLGKPWASDAPWRTRIPPATPLGRTVINVATTFTRLSPPPLTVVDYMTVSSEFTPSTVFVSSASLPPPTPSPHSSLAPEEYEESIIETITVSQSLSEVYESVFEASEVISFSVQYSVSQGTTYTQVFSFYSNSYVLTIRISYVPIAITVIYATATYIRISAGQLNTPIPEERDAGLIIGLATGIGLLVALLLGVFVWLMRKMRQESRTESSPEVKEYGTTMEGADSDADAVEVDEPVSDVDIAPPEINRASDDDDDLEAIAHQGAGDEEQIWV
jgi:hypothetical protein